MEICFLISFFRDMADIHCEGSECVAQDRQGCAYGICCYNYCQSPYCSSHAWKLHYFELRHCPLTCNFISIFFIVYAYYVWLFLTGDVIVQNGATSMVGQCVIQLAKSRGIHNINIIRDRWGAHLKVFLCMFWELLNIFYTMAYLFFIF